jgi:hypothetical protein
MAFQLDSSRVDYYRYLFKLRDSAVTNMFGAGAYLERKFSLEQYEADEIMMDWMENYNDIWKALNEIPTEEKLPRLERTDATLESSSSNSESDDEDRQDMLRDLYDAIKTLNNRKVRSILSKKNIKENKITLSEITDALQALYDHALEISSAQVTTKNAKAFGNLLTYLLDKNFIRDDTFTKIEMKKMIAVYPRVSPMLSMKNL